MARRNSPQSTTRDLPSSGIAVAYIDGGARGNPGEAGFGVYLKDPAGREHNIWGYLGVKTNNYAEYAALLAALRYSLRRKFNRLKIYSDSELLVRQIKGDYRVRNESLKSLHAEALRLISRLSEFKIEHVPRGKNREADKLVNLAIDSRKQADQEKEPG